MKFTRRTTAAAATIGLAAAMLVAAPTTSTATTGTSRCDGDPHTVRSLLQCVTIPGVMTHERAFQRIANKHGGTRASGTPGYDASAAYVAKRMRQAGYTVSTQTFPFVTFAIAGPSALDQLAPGQTSYVEGVDFAPTDHSEPGDVTAAVTPVDIQLGLGNTSTSGCDAADFAGFPAGNIALIQRGTCTFQLKGENAAAAGAVGVLLFNQGNTDAPDRTGIPAVTLGAGYAGGLPALNTTYALGATLVNTPGLRMRLFSNVTRTHSQSSNVFAESKRGDPHNVVMAGAHLDSVSAGPGINDNGSGSSALLEVAEQLNKLKPVNKLRFAWWGGEEGNLVGSNFYMTNLPDDQVLDIEMYLNFDMIASPNYGLFAYDGDGSSFGLTGPDGSDEIEALFQRFFSERGIPLEASEFNGRSDYQGFILNGIPAGGLFTGAEGIKTADQVAKWGGTAGVAYDSCYHQACDTIANLSRKALGINADAMAYVTFLYATGREAINN